MLTKRRGLSHFVYTFWSDVAILMECPTSDFFITFSMGLERKNKKTKYNEKNYNKQNKNSINGNYYNVNCFTNARLLDKCRQTNYRINKKYG